MQVLLTSGPHQDVALGRQNRAATKLVAQMVKNLSAVRETQIGSLGREDPLEREWLPTPVFLPGESHGQRNLVGYSPWGHKESDTTEQLTQNPTHLG